MKLTPTQQAQRLYDFALANYEKGYDHIIECMTVAQIEKEYIIHSTFQENFRAFKQDVRSYRAYADDIEASAF